MTIKKTIKSLITFIKIKRAIHKAKKLHVKYNEQYFVLKMNGKIIIMDKPLFTQMRQKN